MQDFKGWHLSENLLYDPEGNRYTPERVRSSQTTLELANDLLGKPHQIASMKQRLERRLKPFRVNMEIEVDGQSVRVIRTWQDTPH